MVGSVVVPKYKLRSEMNISYPHVFVFFSILMFFYFLFFVQNPMNPKYTTWCNVLGNVIVGAFFAGVLTLFVWTVEKALGL